MPLLALAEQAQAADQSQPPKQKNLPIEEVMERLKKGLIEDQYYVTGAAVLCCSGLKPILDVWFAPGQCLSDAHVLQARFLKRSLQTTVSSLTPHRLLMAYIGILRQCQPCSILTLPRWE